MTNTRKQLISVLERDGYECHYCGDAIQTPVSGVEHAARQPKNIATRDHIIPVGLGGQNVQSNMVAACEHCNNAKADMLWDCDCKVCRVAIDSFNQMYSSSLIESSL